MNQRSDFSGGAPAINGRGVRASLRQQSRHAFASESINNRGITD